MRRYQRIQMCIDRPERDGHMLAYVRAIAPLAELKEIHLVHVAEGKAPTSDEPAVEAPPVPKVTEDSLAALADETRLRILAIIREQGEICSQELIDQLGISQSSISRHLRQLTATGYLVERRTEAGKCFNLNTERIGETLQAGLHHGVHYVLVHGVVEQASTVPVRGVGVTDMDDAGFGEFARTEHDGQVDPRGGRGFLGLGFRYPQEAIRPGQDRSSQRRR